MNSHCHQVAIGAGSRIVKMHSNYRSRNGASMVDMAIAAPVLALILVIGTDFGRLYYTNIEVANAARAGAQYGSQSLIAAADSPGMSTAAKTDGANLTGMTVTSKQCTCMTSTTVAACDASYCTSNPQATFVEVDTNETFHTILTYPGVPSSIALAGKAIMRVEQ
jgi:Flp pilus assembly protein TadG